MHKQCVVCGDPFEAKRAAAKYCSERCKKRAQRRPDRAPAGESGSTVVQFPGSAGPDAGGAVEAATRVELEAAARLESALGQAALVAARRVDEIGSGETGSGVKALIDAHRQALAEAVKDAKPAGDPVEDIRRSAALKLIATRGTG